MGRLSGNITRELKQTLDVAFERFPVKKREIHEIVNHNAIAKEIDSEEEAEFILLDDYLLRSRDELVDDDEAEFIRLDELIERAKQKEPQSSDEIENVTELKEPVPNLPKPTRVIFTLFPRYRYQYIGGHLSRPIRHALYSAGKNINVPICLTRVRPLYVQWEIEIHTIPDPEETINIFRSALDKLMKTELKLSDSDNDNGQSFWADQDLIQTDISSFSNADLIQLINQNQILEEVTTKPENN